MPSFNGRSLRPVREATPEPAVSFARHRLADESRLALACQRFAKRAKLAPQWPNATIRSPNI
jgi:hypothetical protein